MKSFNAIPISAGDHEKSQSKFDWLSFCAPEVTLDNIASIFCFSG
jgi:hypothetical protein